MQPKQLLRDHERSLTHVGHKTAHGEKEGKYVMTSLLLKSAFSVLIEPQQFCSLTLTFLLSKP